MTNDYVILYCDKAGAAISQTNRTSKTGICSNSTIHAAEDLALKDIRSGCAVEESKAHWTATTARETIRTLILFVDH